MAFFVYRANHGTKAWYQIMGCLGGISSEQKGTKSRYQRTQITVAKRALSPCPFPLNSRTSLPQADDDYSHQPQRFFLHSTEKAQILFLPSIQKKFFSIISMRCLQYRDRRGTLHNFGGLENHDSLTFFQVRLHALCNVFYSLPRRAQPLVLNPSYIITAYAATCSNLMPTNTGFPTTQKREVLSSS